MSRCLGDYRMKCIPDLLQSEQPLTPEPFFRKIDGFKQGDFIILGSSGLWEMFPNAKHLTKLVHSEIVK